MVDATRLWCMRSPYMYVVIQERCVCTITYGHWQLRNEGPKAASKQHTLHSEYQVSVFSATSEIAVAVMPYIPRVCVHGY